MQRDSYSLADIAEKIGATLEGDPNCRIFGVASLAKAQPGQVSFLVNSRYQLVKTSRHEKFLSSTSASAVILAPDFREKCLTNKLLTKDPYQGYLVLATLFRRKYIPPAGIHPSAIIGVNCEIAPTASIGPYCVIGDHCKIGANTIIESHCCIGDHTIIGEDSYLHANVRLYHELELGDRIIIQSGAVIGSEGFGMVRRQEGWKTIPHLGTVMIGNDVEIGANATIDRGVLDDTILEKGVKIDNLVQVAHGVVIGENTVIAGCVGIAGSVRIGKNCLIGGGVSITDNIEICDQVIFTGLTQVGKSINKPGVYSSAVGFLPQKAWRKNIARLHHLDEIARKVHQLEKATHE